jgi:hypothetical protein
MRSSFACLSLFLVLGLVLAGCASSDPAPASSSAALSSCRTTHPAAQGTFAASGNAMTDPHSTPPNPIVRVSAEGESLRFVSMNGETGTITLRDATLSGEFHDDWGIAQVWIAPFSSGRPNVPVKSFELSGGAGQSMPFTFVGAEVSTQNGAFAFQGPLDGWPSYVVAVTAKDDTIELTDGWGATGTITLSGVTVCSGE